MSKESAQFNDSYIVLAYNNEVKYYLAKYFIYGCKQL